MFSRFDTIPACNRRTDRQTPCDGIVRAMHTPSVSNVTPVLYRCANKNKKILIFQPGLIHRQAWTDHRGGHYDLRLVNYDSAPSLSNTSNNLFADEFLPQKLSCLKHVRYVVERSRPSTRIFLSESLLVGNVHRPAAHHQHYQIQ